MRYSIVAFDRETGSVQTLFECNTLEPFRTVESMSDALSQPTRSTRPGRKGRQVMVLGTGEDCPVNMQPGALFESALAASAALGYTFNEVAQALSRAQKAGERTVILHGVELGYADEQGRVD